MLWHKNKKGVKKVKVDGLKKKKLKEKNVTRKNKYSPKRRRAKLKHKLELNGNNSGFSWRKTLT